MGISIHNFSFVQAKAEIRRLLPGGLQESISKVRSSVVSFIDVQLSSTALKKAIIGLNSLQVKAEIELTGTGL